MKTFRLDPTVGDRSTAVVEEVDKLLREGKQVVVTVVDETKRYEDLRDGRIGRHELGSLRDLTTALVEARIVASLTQKQTGRAAWGQGAADSALGGEPLFGRWGACIRGLRIPVATVVDMVAEGMSESEIVAAYPDLEPADVRAVVSRYQPRRNRDRNFAVAGNFERIDPDSRPVSEIPDDANGPRG